jgi:hypothetical protein
MGASHALSEPKARRMGWLLTDALKASSWQAIRRPPQPSMTFSQERVEWLPRMP